MKRDELLKFFNERQKNKWHYLIGDRPVKAVKETHADWLDLFEQYKERHSPFVTRVHCNGSKEIKTNSTEKLKEIKVNPEDIEVLFDGE